MKKIGILVYDASLIGGAEKVAINLAYELSKIYSIHLISVFNKNNASIENKRIKKYVICNEITKSITKNLIGISQKLKKYLKENGIEVLIGITAGVNGIAILATANTNIKTIYCEHSNLENKSYGKKHELRQYFGAKKMNAIVTLTERDRNNFIKFYRISDSKVFSIPNWHTKTNNEECIYNINSKKIITVGRLEKVKGYDLLVKIAKAVRKKHKDWEWHIFGDGTLKHELEKSIEEEQLTDFLYLKGNVTDIIDRYNNYAMFVMTSYYEGLPLVLLEAQERLLPIIAFDCPTGPSEIIENNVNGFIVPCYDVNCMAEKICELIEHKEKRITFSKNSMKNLENFEKEKVLKKWINLIENI